MLVSYLQEWFVPGESDLFPIAVVLVVIGLLLGKRVPQEMQGTMVVSSVLIFLVGTVVQNMLKSMTIDLLLLFFYGNRRRTDRRDAPAGYHRVFPNTLKQTIINARRMAGVFSCPDFTNSNRRI